MAAASSDVHPSHSDQWPPPPAQHSGPLGHENFFYFVVLPSGTQCTHSIINSKALAGRPPDPITISTVRQAPAGCSVAADSGADGVRGATRCEHGLKYTVYWNTLRIT